MPRSNWKGTISFGLVSIPIALYTTENAAEKVSFHQIDKRNNARIKYQRVNVETGQEVPWEDIIKGYEYNKDVVLPVEDDELKKVAGENARTIAIENFINKDEISYIDVEKTYYLLPEKNGDKGYVILREALKRTKKIGIAKVIISTKDYLAAVAPYKNGLVLYLLHYHEQIRQMNEFNFPSENLKEYKVNSKEVGIAEQLIKAMSTKWKPEEYHDEYQLAVHKWAENKIKHKGITKMPQRAPAAGKQGKVVNFVDLLRKSLGENKKDKAPAGNVIHLKKKSNQGKRTMLH